MSCCDGVGTSHRSKIWLNAEPCGFICGMMTWVLLFYGMYTTTYAVIQPWLGFGIHGMFHVILFNMTCIIAIYSHYKVMTTDPGAVPKNARPLPCDDQEFDPESMEGRNKYRKYCRRCKAFKPRRAHHCSICERCILKMDHHCPWVNNCVGLGNHKLFMLFLFWVFAVSVYALILIIAKYMSCSIRRNSKHYCGGPSSNLLVIMLLVEAILFGLFTVCMMADQSESISSNQTQIDRLKNEKFDIQTEINEVFGTPSDVSFSFSWLVPTPVKFPREFVDSINGYILPSAIEDDDDPLDERDSELVPLTRGGGGVDDDEMVRGEERNSIGDEIIDKGDFKERLLSPGDGPPLGYAEEEVAYPSVVDDTGAGLGSLGRTVRSNSGSSNGSITSSMSERDTGKTVVSHNPNVRKRVSNTIIDPK